MAVLTLYTRLSLGNGHLLLSWMRPPILKVHSHVSGFLHDSHLPGTRENRKSDISLGKELNVPSAWARH